VYLILLVLSIILVFKIFLLYACADALSLIAVSDALSRLIELDNHNIFIPIFENTYLSLLGVLYIHT
jgi:hypothetical protein